MKRKPKASATVDRSPEANCNRLFALARLLRRVPSEKFDMGLWASNYKRGVKKPLLSCGTVCCLGGWATNVHPDLELMGGGVHNTRTDNHGSTAVAEAFGLSPDTAYSLVVGSAPHQTPTKAAAAVEKVAVAFAKEHDLSIRYE